jgi:Flp pilus assembly pilin Flp
MSFSSESARGQGLVEYALIISLIAIVVVVALMLIGPPLSEMYNAVLPYL